MGIIYQSVPISSLVTLSPENRRPYFDRLDTMPSNIQRVIFLPQTGAFIRGLAKTYDIPLEKSPVIALVVLRTTFGEISLSNLTTTLATELQISQNSAQPIATEIEKELFAPIALEFNQYLNSKPSNPVTTLPPTSNMPNVINLKNQPPKPPLPPPIPR